jgi:hypothetical protein
MQEAFIKKFRALQKPAPKPCALRRTIPPRDPNDAERAA